MASLPPLLPLPSNPNPKTIRRRSLLLLSSAAAALPMPLPAVAGDPPSPAITDRVFMDFSLCPSFLRPDRPPAPDLLSACPDSEPLGRIIFGLYGKVVPKTVANFKAMCATSSYRGALVHKILEGEFFAAGRQGRREKGEVRPPPNLVKNSETVDPQSFQLKHWKPGTLSLCLSENDDDDEIRLDPEYHNVEFLVTTGPGPCPRLDDQNIVFGTVLEGLDVVSSIAAIRTYKPSERIRQFNDLAEFLGDERAVNARALWNRPLKTVYISDCGELKVAKPSLSPSLP
ncbi:putative peptidylprolyl isomerase [Dioscorea sansibarensis]